MELKDWVIIGISTIMALIQYAYSRDIQRIKEDIDEVEEMIKTREERNYTAHGELWKEFRDMQMKYGNDITKIGTKIESCPACRGDRDE